MELENQAGRFFGASKMKLAPRELNKLVLHGAGVLAQKRLARGLRLNHPEAVALIATQVSEWVRGIRNLCFLMKTIGRVLQPPGFHFFPVLIHLFSFCGGAGVGVH